MLENKKKQPKKYSHTSNVNRDYTHLDDVINDALLLSDLRKPSNKQTKTDEHGQTIKKVKHRHLSPILFVSLQRLTGKKRNRFKTKLVKALVDTGASESIITTKAAKGLPLDNKKVTKTWSTAAGMLNTNAKTKKLQFSLPELQSNRQVLKSFHVVDIDLKNYEAIIGRDLITALQLDVKDSDLSIKWDDAAIPWRSTDCTVADIYLTDDHFSTQPIEQEMQRMTDILDAKY